MYQLPMVIPWRNAFIANGNGKLMQWGPTSDQHGVVHSVSCPPPPISEIGQGSANMVRHTNEPGMSNSGRLILKPMLE